MIGRIYTILESQEEIAEALNAEITPDETEIYFDSTSVTSMYLVEESDQKMIYACVGGVIYPFLYEDIIYEALKEHLKDK